MLIYPSEIFLPNIKESVPLLTTRSELPIYMFRLHNIRQAQLNYRHSIIFTCKLIIK